MSTEECCDNAEEPRGEMLTETEHCIKETKQFRVDLDAILQCLKCAPRQCRERSLCVTKLQEAIMWLGMDLKDLDCENPYPDSYDPSNAKVAPTADGLKL